MKRTILLLLTLIAITSCTNEKKIDLKNLDLVKAAMTGQWYFVSKGVTVSQYFDFTDESYDGQCYSNQYRGGKLFTLVRDDNTTCIEWHITKGNPSYVITELTSNKMVTKFSNGNIQTIEYFKK